MIGIRGGRVPLDSHVSYRMSWFTMRTISKLFSPRLENRGRERWFGRIFFLREYHIFAYRWRFQILFILILLYRNRSNLTNIFQMHWSHQLVDDVRFHFMVIDIYVWGFLVWRRSFQRAKRKCQPTSTSYSLLLMGRTIPIWRYNSHEVNMDVNFPE